MQEDSVSVDNRTVINDCEAVTGWTGDDAVTVVTLTGSFYEGSSSLSTQLSNADEHMFTTQDSVGAGTFSLNWADTTVYMLVKDNLTSTAALGGTQIVISDGTNTIGYDVGGNDAVGLLLPTYFQSYKLDISVVVATPGNNVAYAGSEASLAQTTITGIGYGALHLAKANGPSDNAFMDCFRYIANDSYALTINGGTVGTPETMADVQGDDVTNGWGLVGNPIGNQFWFNAPTEWGESVAAADHYFTASDEQWFWLGDNAGGASMGVGHFIFRVVGNATDTGSFVIGNIVVVNTGTGANFDCSSANIDTCEIDACSFTGLATFVAPVVGGTSRFVTSTQFIQCGTITHNGTSMNGSSVLDSIVLADTGALVYNIAADPNGEMDDMSFTKGTLAHHAVEFGTSAPATMTITGMTNSGFNALDGQNDSTFLFPDTGGDVNWTLNIVGGTGIFTYKKVRAGDTVTIVTDPVTLTITAVDATDGTPIQNARVFVVAGTSYVGGGDVTITRVTTTATVAHTAHGYSTGDSVRILGANQTDYIGVFVITVTTVNAYTYTVANSPTTPATGAIKSALVIINALSDVSGQAADTRSWGADQDFTGRVLKGTASPVYKAQPVSGTIDSATGASATAPMAPDED
jgi:hypothetical protein